MTVVGAIRLNSDNVIGASDEGATIGYRTEHTVKKIYPIGKNHFYGAAGIVSFSESMLSEALDNIKNGMSTKEISYELYKASRKEFDDYVQKNVLDDYGISKEQLTSNRSGIDTKIKDEIWSRIGGVRNGYRTDFIVAGIDENDSKIFIGPMTAKPFDRGKYKSIGSGADRADIVMSDFFEKLKVSDRDSIPKYKGCEVLLRAVRSAWGNEGVGGRTQLVGAERGKNGLWEISPEMSNMLQNVLYLNQYGYVEDNYVDGIFKDVIENDASRADVLKELRKKIGFIDMSRIFFEEGLHR